MAESQMIKVPKDAKVKLTPEEKCRAAGGIWNGKTCVMPTTAKEQQTEQTLPPTTQRELIEQQKKQAAVSGAEARKKAEFDKQKAEADLDKPLGAGIDLTKPTETSTEQQTEQDLGKKIKFLQDGTIEYSMGGETVILTKDEYDTLQGKGGMVTENVARARDFKTEQQLQAEQLGGQVGQFGQLGISPTELDWGEALTTSLVQQLPKAITYGLGAAALTGAGMNPASIIAGVGTFLGTLTGGMISNMKSQRSDTTTAQQRVLDEGKQTMKDWATLAETDPANKAKYLTEYNKVAAQIDQAYRQMKLDTSRDVTKFETALPNLAEFEAFYAAGGERDTLDVEMRNSLASPTPVDYKMMELMNRRQ